MHFSIAVAPMQHAKRKGRLVGAPLRPVKRSLTGGFAATHCEVGGMDAQIKAAQYTIGR